jgi:hypothetical protein
MDKFIEKYYKGLISKDRYNLALENAANNLGIPSDWLSAIIYIETAFSMNPYEKRNPFAIGLIQFTDLAITELSNKKYLPQGYKKEMLLTETIEFQFDLVVDYFRMQQKATGMNTLDSVENMYLLVFYPTAVDEMDSYVFRTKSISASKIASQNPTWDVNKNGEITAGEVRENFRTKLPFKISDNVLSPELEAARTKKKR